MEAITEAWARGTQIEAQDEGIEEIFRKIQTAFALDVIFEIAVPIARLLQLRGVVGQIERRQSLVRSDGRQPGPSSTRWIQRAVLVGGAVVVAEGDQRPDFEPQVLWRFRMVVALAARIAPPCCSRRKS